MSSKKRKIMTRIVCAVIAGIMLSTSVISPKAEEVTTLSANLPVKSTQAKMKVTVNSAGGTRTYSIYAQGKSKNKYIKAHGCAVSSLTTILSAYTTEYENYTPSKVSKTVEKEVFGKAAWKKNYKGKKMPVSLYGINKILNTKGIQTTYVQKYKDQAAIQQITDHLKSGHPVIIETDNRRRVNGKVVGGRNYKWAGSKHTMVLLGMTESGKAIVADSAQRTWSKNQQRVKYASVKELVSYMLPCTSKKMTVYYSKSSACGGYILVY